MKVKVYVFYLVFLFFKLSAQTTTDELCNDRLPNSNLKPEQDCLIETSNSEFPMYSIGYMFDNQQLIDFNIRYDDLDKEYWIPTIKNDLAHLEFPSETKTVLLEKQRFIYTTILKFNGQEIYRTPDIFGRGNFLKFCPNYNTRFTEQGEFQTYVNIDNENTYECLGLVNWFPFKDYRIRSTDQTINKGKKLYMTPHANFYIRDANDNIIWDFFSSVKNENLMDKVLNLTQTPLTTRRTNFFSVKSIENTPEELSSSPTIKRNETILLKSSSSYRLIGYSYLYFDEIGDLLIYNQSYNSWKLERIWKSPNTNSGSKNDFSRGQSVVWNNSELKVLNHNGESLYSWRGINSFNGSYLIFLPPLRQTSNATNDLIQVRNGDDLPLACLTSPNDFIPFPTNPRQENISKVFPLDKILFHPSRSQVFDYAISISAQDYRISETILRFQGDNLIIANNYMIGNDYDIIKAVQVLDTPFLSLREAFLRFGYEDAGNSENKAVEFYWKYLDSNSSNPNEGELVVNFLKHQRQLNENEILENSSLLNNDYIDGLMSDDGNCTFRYDKTKGYVLENNQDGTSEVIVDKSLVGDQSILTIEDDGSVIIKDIVGNNTFQKPIILSSSISIPKINNDLYSLSPEYNTTANKCILYSKNETTNQIVWSNTNGMTQVNFFEFPTEGSDAVNGNEKIVNYKKELLNPSELNLILSKDKTKLSINFGKEIRNYSKNSDSKYFDIQSFDSKYLLE